MKKIIYLLTMLLCCGMLSSCGGGNTSNTSSDTNSEDGLDDTRDYSNESMFEDEDDGPQYGEASNMQICREAMTKPSDLWVRIDHNVSKNGVNGSKVSFGLKSNPFAEDVCFKTEVAVLDQNGNYISCSTTNDNYLHWYSDKGVVLPGYVEASLDADQFIPYNLLKELVKGRSYYIRAFLVDCNNPDDQIAWSEPLEFHMN